jgi:glycine/D-amino acid oxidase-like deaminating enzyme
MDLKSNEPFWLVKNGIMHSYASLRESISCEVLIVGSGITGSLIAHQCVAEGYDTVVIDKRETRNGSTSATTSILQYEIDVSLHELIPMIGEKGAIATYKACADAIDTLGNIATEIRSKAGFSYKKSLYYAARKKDVDELYLEYETRKQAGFAVKWLDASQIEKKYTIHEAYGGILSDKGASVDAFCLAGELLEYNHKKGLRIYDKTELKTVTYHPNTAECIVDTGVTIKAKRIIYCVGFESTQLIKEKFVNLLSTYALVSEVNKALYRPYDKLLLWNTGEPYLYMRTTRDGRFLIGGEDEDFVNPQKRDALLAKKERKLLQSFTKTFPDKVFYPDFAWAGTFGETKDGLPYIGVHPDFQHSYFVLGFGGNGITFSVTGMAMVAAWLQRKAHPLTPYFAFGR